MGDISDAMLNGYLCCVCGGYIEGGLGDGKPRYCEDCLAEEEEPMSNKECDCDVCTGKVSPIHGALHMLLSKGPEKFRPAIAFLLSSNTDQVVVATRLGPDGKPDVNSAVPLPAEKAIIASDDDERSMVSFEDISHVITAIKNTDMMGRFDQQTIIYGLLILAQELCVKVDPRVAIGIQGVLAMCKEPVDGIYVEGADGPIKH